MDIIYRYRNILDDHHSSDDRLFVDFKTEKVDYQYLVETIIPQYIDIFDGYHAAIYNELLIYEDFEKSRNKNNRKTIVRVYPAVYYDTKFCKDVFKMNPKDIFEKLNGWIYNVSLYGDGVLIIADTKPLSVGESDVFDIKVKKLLGYKD